MIDSPELLDGREIAVMLRELRQVNRWLGGTAACLRAVRAVVETRLRQGQGRKRVRIVDFGSGSADIPVALVKWARGKGYPIQVTAIDSNFLVCKTAVDQTSRFPEISIIHGDVRNPPVKQGAYDLALCSAFLHHFADEQIRGIVTNLRANAREAVVISDLQRHVLAYLGIRLLTSLFSRSRAVRRDGPLSVRKGFRRAELLTILNQAGITAVAVKWRWAFRYVVVIQA